ncbi:outer membrane protein [Rhizobium sp. LjRoot254]|uniref:outer membrane protein n=1 Tax=Rhizobium sp. LjRoot254 TaxID=3342297 RepID=UPI003ECD1B34
MKTLVLTALLSALAIPAFAADMVEAPPEPVATEVVTAFDWSGAYIGIQAGGSWLNGEFSADGDSADQDFNGGFVGKFIGYNFTFDNFVIGAEGDINYNWNDNNYRVGGVRGDVGTDWSGSLRARLGYSFDRVLIYVTGGWAMTNAHVDQTPGKNWDRNFNGWTIGKGIDYAVTDNVFVRAEYRYTDYSDRNFGGVKVDLDQHTATIGVAYKF